MTPRSSPTSTGSGHLWPAPLRRDSGFWQQNSMLLVLLLLIAAATLISNGVFIRPANLITFLYQSSIVGVLAISQTLVILAGGLDLSVAALTILTAIVMGAASTEQQSYLPAVGALPAIGLGLGAAAVVGLTNGLFVSRTRIPPFIVTLAMFLMVSGCSYLITGGAPIYYPAPLFEAFGQAKLLGIPNPVYVWLGLTLVAQFLLARTRLGAEIYAVGGNERAALLSGLRVGRVKQMVYVLSSLLAGVAGFLFLARTGYAIPSAGGDYTMDSIAAVVVGGVSLTGGRGSIKDALIGVLILAILGNLMNILLISPYIQAAIKGVIILLAVWMNLRVAGQHS